MSPPGRPLGSHPSTMADEPQISILDARLAEIDRRLRTIQTGLADDADAPPDAVTGLPPKIAVPEPSARSGPAAMRTVTLAPPAPEDATTQDESADEDPALVIAELRGLISDHARLLDAMGELLASGERLLARAHALAPPERRSPLPAAAPPVAAPPAPAPAAPVTVTAGPFSSLEAVRDFERALGTLPNVASVDVRGYEGEDRAMVDVHLSRPNP
jgi:hypothetical protein